MFPLAWVLEDDLSERLLDRRRGTRPPGRAETR